jgi:hypothetical protein
VTSCPPDTILSALLPPSRLPFTDLFLIFRLCSITGFWGNLTGNARFAKLAVISRGVRAQGIVGDDTAGWTTGPGVCPG